MIVWKKLKSKIPHRVQITTKVWYEILWSDDFADQKTLGEMRPDVKQIVIKTNEPPKLTVVTYLHELFHSISEEYDVGLTESQILKLEKAFYYLLKPGNIFKDKKDKE